MVVALEMDENKGVCVCVVEKRVHETCIFFIYTLVILVDGLWIFTTLDCSDFIEHIKKWKHNACSGHLRR